MIKFCRKSSNGQIATILTLIIAAIFIFTVITLNVRRITQRKAVIDNAVDGAALFFASNVGSLGNKLSHEYLNGDTEKCGTDWLFLGIIVGTVVTAVVGIFFPPAWAGTIAGISAATATTAILAVAAGGALYVAGQVAHMVAIEPKQFENFSLYFKQMTAEQQLIEGAIQLAAFGVINDMQEVIDVNDEDGDGFTNDKILKLTQKYYERLRSLPSLRDTIKSFIIKLREFVSVKESEKSWDIISVLVPDPDSYSSPPDYSCQPNRSGVGDKEEVKCARGSWIWSKDDKEWIWQPLSFADWLTGDFTALLDLLEEVGYGVTFDRDQVKELSLDIHDFEEWAESLLKQSADQRLAGFDQWYSQLIPPNPKDPNDVYWQDRLILWQTYINNWIAQLEVRQGMVQACVDKCCAREWGCWGDDCEGGSCCAEECVQLQRPADTGYVILAYNREGASSVYDSGAGILPPSRKWMFAQEEGDGDVPPGDGDTPPPGDGDEPPPDEPPPCTNVCVGWQGCCGPERCCGDLCEDANCRPTEPCTTFKGERNCCESGHRIQDNCDRSTSKIVRALEDHLIIFKNKLDTFVNYLPVLKGNVDKFNKDFSQKLTFGYDWNDSMGYHKVLVSIEPPLDKTGRFIGPYLHPERDWWSLWAHKCVRLKNYKDEFKMKVSRYDKEEAKGIKGILDLLNWNRTITSEVKGYYGKDKTDIKIQRIR